MLWLCLGLADAAPIQPLVQELPYAVGAALKKKKKERKKERKKEMADNTISTQRHLSRFIITIFHMFKKVKESMSLSKAIENMKRSTSNL